MHVSPFRPSDANAARFHSAASGLAFSDEVRALFRGDRPPAFVEDHTRRRIGSGRSDFDLAGEAIRTWRMFGMPWLEVLPAGSPIAEGTTVVIRARAFGAWTLSPARILATFDEPGTVERFGFTYGSLPGHAEEGIESFAVEWDHADDSVWYDLHSFSRAGRWFTKLMHPLTRKVQRKFARDSGDAMAAFVAREPRG